MQQRRNDDEQRMIREEMAATQQSFRQIIDQKEGQVRQARENEQAAMAAAGASTDEIRRARRAEEIYQTLAADLGDTKDKAVSTIAARNREIATMQQRELDLWTQQMENAVANAERAKGR